MKDKDIRIEFWQLATLAVILLFAPLMQSCGGLKQSTDNRNHTTDSVMDRTVITSKILTVPLTQADLRLDLADIANLTPGAVFTDQNGQAKVKVERRGDTIYVTATCDSLQLVVESQYREISRLHTQLEQQKTETVKPPGWWERTKNNAFYIAVGMALMLVLILIKKIWERIKQPVNLLR